MPSLSLGGCKSCAHGNPLSTYQENPNSHTPFRKPQSNGRVVDFGPQNYNLDYNFGVAKRLNGADSPLFNSEF